MSFFVCKSGCRFELEKRGRRVVLVNTGHCSHFGPYLPGRRSVVPVEVPLLPLHLHPASAYFDKGQSRFTASSSMHSAAALGLEIDTAHRERS